MTMTMMGARLEGTINKDKILNTLIKDRTNKLHYSEQ